jgi:hypothetical protein
MSLIDITTEKPPINEIIETEAGVCEVNLSVKSLSIKKQVDGTVSISARHADKEIIFILPQEKAVRLGNLILSQAV